MKKKLKTEGLYTPDNLQSFSSWMSVFTANSSEFSTTQTLLFSKHFHRFCCWFEWLEAEFQKSIFGHLVEKKRCTSDFHRHSFQMFRSDFFQHCFRSRTGKPLFLYSFCDVRINVCVSVTFVYFILNPTVNLSSDKSSGLSPPFSISFSMFSQAFFATCKNKSPHARFACVTLNEKWLQTGLQS